MAYVIKCDRCGTVGEPGRSGHVPKGWKQISLQVTGARTYWKLHQFCPVCVEHLGIEAELVEETSAKKLVAILESMVEEAVDEREA